MRPPGRGTSTACKRDGTTRLDRWETALNGARPNEARDTTTSAAMSHNLRTLVLGKLLTLASRDQLERWLTANRTGDARPRAGLPAAWHIADKTGIGDFGTANDVAVIWPLGREAVVATDQSFSGRCQLARSGIPQVTASH
nr:serine hydrolase [Azohydromonas australica]